MDRELAETLAGSGFSIGVIKFDCLTGDDHTQYARACPPVKKGVAGGLCPDHFFVANFVANIEGVLQWGIRGNFDILISESAGLCNRCSPHIKGVLAVCVIDHLSGVNTPRKIGPDSQIGNVKPWNFKHVHLKEMPESYFSNGHKNQY